MPGRGQPLIGDIAALTGISAGRIRHYEKIGLLELERHDSGYRFFAPEQVLLLLRIDMLRSLGLGLSQIRAGLGGNPADLRQALEEHRRVLESEKARVETLLAAVADALSRSDEDQEALIARLASTHRDSLGLFGRLRRPLAPAAASAFNDLMLSWHLPVPPMFGQMLLPEAVGDFLEALLETPGHELLFARLYDLAGQVLALPADDLSVAEELARAWVAAQLTVALPAELKAVLATHVPFLASDPSLQHGLAVWAEALSPAAAVFLDEVAKQCRDRDAVVLGVIVVAPTRS